MTPNRTSESVKPSLQRAAKFHRLASQITGIVIVKSKSNHVYVIDSHKRKLNLNEQLTISGAM